MTDAYHPRWPLVLLLALLCPAAGSAWAQGTFTVSNSTVVVSGNGVIDLEDGTMTFDSGGALSETTGGRVTGGLLTTTRALNAPAGLNVAGLGLTITSPADLGTTTVTRGHEAQTGEGNQGIFRYYDVAPANNAGLDATLAFQYDDAELNGLAEATLVLFRSTDGGVTWGKANGTIDVDANTVTLTGVEAFSRWTLGSTDAELPVELVSFEAAFDGREAVLQWATASETNNAGFDVEHRRDEVFQSIGFVAGHGTTAEASRYHFRTDHLPPGTHTFRLKQVDFDGAFSHSAEVELTLDATGVSLTLRGLPARDAIAGTLALPQGTGRVALYDALGRQMLVQEDVVGRFTLDVAGLSSGLYLLRAEAGATVLTRPVIVAR